MGRSAASAVYVIVMAVLVAAIFKKKRATAETPPDVTPDKARETKAANVVKAAVAVTTVTLFVLMITSFRTGTAINQLAEAAEDPLIIQVTGNQWWWDVRYMDAKPSNDIETANEIHLPVGRPVKLELSSTDVIHSFFIPSLGVKRYAIPGRTIETWLEASQPGVFYGECNQICGNFHSYMPIAINAVSAADFQAWEKDAKVKFAAGEPIPQPVSHAPAAPARLAQVQQ